MKRNLRQGILVVVALLLLFSVGLSAQTTSSSSASASFQSGQPIEIRLGGLAFEPGAWVALEISRDPAATCLLDPITVFGLQLASVSGEMIRVEEYAQALDLSDWLGRIRLASPDGSPLGVGAYSLAVTTSEGLFIAEFEIVEPSRLARLGSYSTTASVCGLSLNVYRLLQVSDHGSYTKLRVGDRIMIALPGNPTTGYQWDFDLLHEPSTIDQTRETEFRAMSPAAIGSGGIFLLRFVAVEVGLQQIRLVYHRPWESVQPLRTIDLHVVVD